MEVNPLHEGLLAPKEAPPSKYLGPEENKLELLAHLSSEVRAEWESYGNQRIEPAFQDRVFVLYQPTGRGNNGIQRAPKIISTVRVLSFVARDDGACIRVLEEASNRTLEVSFTPVKLFEYPVFLAIPPSFTYRWDAHLHGGKIQRTANYLLFVRTRNKASFFSTGNIYLETPNDMRQLYSHLDLKLDL